MRYKACSKSHVQLNSQRINALWKRQQQLQGKKVAILLTDGFEQVEMTEPRKALQEAGATTHLISPKGGEVKGWDETEWGGKLPRRSAAGGC